MTESSSPRRTLRERCRAIELLVLDVDGVLTDGGIVYGAVSGEANLEIKGFHVRDGSGLKRWHQAGKQSAIITGRSSPVVSVRAAELGIACVLQGMSDKGQGLEELLRQTRIPLSAIAYVGDDQPDVPALRRVGLACGVADGCAEARAVSHYVTTAPGGHGAVREVIERILRCQGHWKDLE